MYGTGVGATVAAARRNCSAPRRHHHDARRGSSATSPTSTALRGTPATGFGADLEVEGELSALAYDDGFTNSASETALQGHPALFAAPAVRQRPAGARREGRARSTRIADRRDARRRRAARVGAASPPMSTLIQLTNTPSDNFFAETLLKDIGARFGGGRHDRRRRRGRQGRDRRASSAQSAARRRLGAVALRPYDRRTGRVTAGADGSQLRASSTRSRSPGESGTMQDEMLGTSRRRQLPGKDRHAARRREPRRLLHRTQRRHARVRVPG